MELLVYTRLFREKFQKESFFCENDILLAVLDGAFEVQGDGGAVLVEANQAFHFFKDKPYERRVLSPLTMVLFRYQSEHPIFDREHIVFRDIRRFRSTLALANACAQMTDAIKRREHLLWDLAEQYEIERESGDIRREDAKMAELEKRLRETMATDMSIRALAEECGLSHVQMIRRFRSAFGHTPSEHLYALRLERAKELLLQTALPVKTIARDCGFENEYYFSNFFKRHEGLSPTAYRAMIP